MPMTFTIDAAPRTLPHRPIERAGVVRVFNGYAVPGVATVSAWPHRGMTHARQLARRLYRRPADYLWAVRTFDVPGVQICAAAEPARRIRLAA